MFKRLFIVVSLLIVMAATAWPVFAHAELLRSIPEANAALDSSPTQIELFFSEALEPSFSAITVLNSGGARVDNNDSRLNPADPTQLSVTLRTLPDGVYTVSWKVLSAVDGHVTAGAFPFAVGDVDAAALAAAEQASKQTRISLAEVISRWWVFIAALAIVGGAVFVPTVWQPAANALALPPGSSNTFNQAWRTLGVSAIVVLTLASVTQLMVHVGQASGTEIAAPWNAATASVLFGTRYGVLWLARIALLFALAGILPRARRTRDRWITAGIGMLLLLTISLGSHAAAEPRPLVPITADWLHLIAASAWVGGLSHFVAGMWLARTLDSATRTQLAAKLIPRFSALALISVGIIVLTGVFSAVLRIGTWQALNSTLYGRVLIAKTIIALPMLALGALNLLAVSPQMKRAAAAGDSSGGVVALFRRIITGELGLGVLLLLSVGLLTALPPARAVSAPPALTASATADDLKLNLEVAPGRIGVNTFTLTLRADGQPVENTKEVLLRFTPVSGRLPTSEATLQPNGNGQYAVVGSYFSLPDSWQVQAVVRREDKFDSFANFALDVGVTTGSLAWHKAAGVALLAAALLYVFAFSVIGRSQAQLIGFGLAPAFALALVSVSVFYNPPATASPNMPLNPIAPNADSVAIGQDLYQANCVPCHGETGQGDGPVGLTLNPRPADLSQHAVPGVHPDGQLYLWISDGFTGSVMPAFRNNLSETERWHLVNYIRTFAPK